MNEKYAVIRYAPDGSVGESAPGAESDGQQVFVADTLTDARDWIRKRIAGDYGRWDPSVLPDDGTTIVEAWHDSGKEGCGGYEIREVPTRSLRR